MATRLNQRHTTIHNAAHSLRRTPETPRLRLVSGVESDTTNSAQAGRSLHRRKLADFLALPMGWVSSPPVFCTATEVATDVANKEIASNWRPPPHRQEQAADTEVDIDPTRKRSVRGKPPRIRHRNKGPLG
ncbi:hypothetical protein THAOC_28720, partial [Thalassiosira oceanica]